MSSKTLVQFLLMLMHHLEDTASWGFSEGRDCWRAEKGLKQRPALGMAFSVTGRADAELASSRVSAAVFERGPQKWDSESICCPRDVSCVTQVPCRAAGRPPDDGGSSRCLSSGPRNKIPRPRGLDSVYFYYVSLTFNEPHSVDPSH